MTGFVLFFALGNGESATLAVDEAPTEANVAKWRARADEVYADRGGVTDATAVPVDDIEAEIADRRSAIAKGASR